MTAVKLGIIGCGKVVSQVHLPALRGVRQAVVSAVADPIEKNRIDVAMRCGASAVFADWRGLLEERTVQGVLICTPSADHSECAIQAFAHGKHVYLEKPIAASPTEAQAVVKAWEETNLLGMMGFNYRQHPLFIRARDLVRSGRLGAILGVESVFTSSGGWVHEWKQKRATAGGVLFDLATHHIDLTHFVLGQSIVEASAQVASKHTEQDTSWIRMTLQDGVVVQSFFCLYGTDVNRFEIYGDKARLTVDYVAKTLSVAAGGQRRHIRRIMDTLGEETLRLKNAVASRRDPSYQTALGTFVSGIGGGCRYIQPDLRDGLRTCLVIDAAERSASSGRNCRVTPF
jgi:predicted dehydrogenase